MALLGNAVVAIWNDIAAEGRANFYEWHNREHMPERLGIDGFLRGRRYQAIPGELAGRPAYFTLYEVLDPEVLSGAGYLARLNSPTEWTKTSVAHFRDVARSLCRDEISMGAASGGFVATLRFDCDPVGDSMLLRTLHTTLAGLMRTPCILACHATRADLAVSTAKTAEQAGRPDNAVPRWVVMIESSTAEAARAAMRGPLGQAALESHALINSQRGVYGMQFDQLVTGIAYAQP